MALGEEVLGSTPMGIDKMLSSAIPLGTKQVDHLIDLAALPADAIVDFELEVSEDAGVNWKALGKASIMVGDRRVGEPSGIGVHFPAGSQDPNYMIRTVAKIRGSAVAVPGVMMERLEHVITAPSQTALGTLAAGMSPGTWAQLVVPNQDAILSDTGSTGSMLPFSNAMPWNPVRKCIEIVAGDHQGATPGMRHVRYDAATNTFVNVQAAPAIPGIGHGYDHTAVNPANGDVYSQQYGTTTAYRKQYADTVFSSIGSWTGFSESGIAACWWSGAFTGGGAQGSFMVYTAAGSTNVSTDGTISAFNPLTGTWFYNATSRSPFYGAGSTYSTCMEYSNVRNCAVYGGGTGAPNKVWRMDADQSVTALTDVPVGKHIGPYGAGGCAGIFVEEPVTGNFLVLSEGELWELNPVGTGTWTQQTGARIPPAGVGVPSESAAAQSVIGCPIAEHGVVVFITQDSSVGGTFYVYKHA